MRESSAYTGTSAIRRYLAQHDICPCSARRGPPRSVGHWPLSTVEPAISHVCRTARCRVIGLEHRSIVAHDQHTINYLAQCTEGTEQTADQTCKLQESGASSKQELF